MEFGLRDLIYAGAILATTISAYFAARINLLSKIHKVEKELKEDIKKLEIELERLKAKDDLQQQIIDQFQHQVLDSLTGYYRENIQKKDRP
jgi:hypothetical protein